MSTKNNNGLQPDFEWAEKSVVTGIFFLMILYTNINVRIITL